VVELSAVNRSVVGSSPTCGAIPLKLRAVSLFLFIIDIFRKTTFEKIIIFLKVVFLFLN
jgi:hypothetical protein